MEGGSGALAGKLRQHAELIPRMPLSFDFPPTRHVPRLWSAIAFLLLLLASAALFAGRKLAWMRWHALLEHAPDFYTHVSNLSISSMLLAGIGFTWLQAGVGFRWVSGLAGAIALANVVYEGFIPILNTPDWIDAWYGLGGTAAALLFLWLVHRHGLVDRPAAPPAP